MDKSLSSHLSLDYWVLCVEYENLFRIAHKCVLNFLLNNYRHKVYPLRGEIR